MIEEALIARSRIKKGDLVIQLWMNYCRPYKSSDTLLSYMRIASSSALKGKRCLTVYSVFGDIYTTPPVVPHTS